MPLRSPYYYAERQIDLVLKSRVSSINVSQKRLQVEGGKTYEFGALLLATGADPVKIPIPGASDSQVYYLRTFADARAGELLVYEDSSQMLAVAISQGNAAERLGVVAGDEVWIRAQR